jgi:hypothetical protein
MPSRPFLLRGEAALPGSIWKNYGFVWVTGGFFLVSLVGRWVFG